KWALGSRPRAKQPQTPHSPCTGQAPTGSSMRSLSKKTTPSKTSTPATPPTTMDQPLDIASQQAVMPTSPPSTPLRLIDKSGLRNTSQLASVAATPPAPAANVVLTAMKSTASMSERDGKASWLPGLKPYQPTHKTKTPSVANARLCPGIGIDRPFT